VKTIKSYLNTFKDNLRLLFKITKRIKS